MLPPVVLILDDEPSSAEAITQSLLRRKLIAEGVITGPDALERLRKNPYTDVVLLDAKLTGMDSIEMLKEIKDVRPLVEVIMLTGTESLRTAVDGMKLGAFDFVMKPYEIDDLLSKIEEAKVKKRSQEEKIQEARVRNIIGRRGY